MSAARALVERWRALADRPAMIWRDSTVAYGRLAFEVEAWGARLDGRADLAAGAVAGLHADYSPSAVALLMALWMREAVVALVSDGLAAHKAELYETAQVGVEAVVDAEDRVRFESVGHAANHPLLHALRDRGAPGLVLFSSGSTGKNKAVVHDADRFVAKYRTPRRSKVTIPFMLFDHVGGLNTLLHVLSSGGTAVFVPDRRPETIVGLIERHRVQVLPASPTFLNLLLLRGLDGRDLSSLETIAYGAERMPAPTLARLRARLPSVRFVQSYGLSEVGIMRTRSKSSDSLWVELGGDGFETRVRDGRLEIKADTAMLGYLNEADPFTDDGWLMTHDRVEVKDGYLRILGRASDIIIVGGEKVYPAEVEDRLLELPGVVEVVVSSEPNALTNQIVRARVRLSTGESRAEFRSRMRDALAGRLPEFKIPKRVEVVDGPLFNARFKRSR